LEGLNGEFPESGLVPATYTYSLVGITAEHDGLHIAPTFNNVYEFMGVRQVRYNGKSYDIRVNRDASCVITATDGAVDMTLKYTPERFSDMLYTVTVINSDGTTVSNVISPVNGVVTAELSYEGVTSVTIVPVIA
jgi:hypothetical protein